VLAVVCVERGTNSYVQLFVLFKFTCIYQFSASMDLDILGYKSGRRVHIAVSSNSARVGKKNCDSVVVCDARRASAAAHLFPPLAE